MRIDRIDQMLEVCQEHLETTDSYGTEIAILLTYALLVRIYAEFEQWIEAIVTEKSAAIRHRSIRVRNLSELLKDLGEQYQTAWAARRSENRQAVIAYSNIVAQRHEIAHSGAAIANFQVGFQEVRAWYESGHIVLDFFRETLFAIDPAQRPV